MKDDPSYNPSNVLIEVIKRMATEAGFEEGTKEYMHYITYELPRRWNASVAHHMLSVIWEGGESVDQ